MGGGCVKGDKCTARLDLTHLVILALIAVVNYHLTADAVAVALTVDQLKSYAVILLMIVLEELWCTVDGVADDIQVTVIIVIDIDKGGAVIQVIKPELLLLTLEQGAVAVVQKDIAGVSGRAHHGGVRRAVDHIDVLPLIVIHIAEFTRPAPTTVIDMPGLGLLLEFGARCSGEQDVLGESLGNIVAILQHFYFRRRRHVITGGAIDPVGGGDLVADTAVSFNLMDAVGHHAVFHHLHAEHLLHLTALFQLRHQCYPAQHPGLYAVAFLILIIIAVAVADLLECHRPLILRRGDPGAAGHVDIGDQIVIVVTCVDTHVQQRRLGNQRVARLHLLKTVLSLIDIELVSHFEIVADHHIRAAVAVDVGDQSGERVPRQLVGNPWQFDLGNCRFLLRNSSLMP